MLPIRVVIAEDEFLLAKNLSDLVVALGHTVVGMAETGPQVIALAREQQPDLILMDIKIPEIDGITASRAIAQEGTIPIIIISAYSNPTYVDGAVDAGVMTYLIKPVSKGDLQAAIDLTLARHREMQALRREVGDLKTTLVQRKTIERAKGLLMEMLHLSEGDAFRRLQQQSQRENRPMVEIAQAVITIHTLQHEDEPHTAPQGSA